MDCKDLAYSSGLSHNEKPPLRVLAAVSDLFFTAKISAAAQQLGLPVEFLRDEEKLRKQAESAPSLVIVDLNNSTLDPIALIAKLKANPSTQQVQVIGFLSHVQQELKREAEKAGCDLVFPRSVFSQQLYDLLRQRSCHL